MSVRGAVADRLVLPPGWIVTDVFAVQSGIITVADGAGVGATVPQVVWAADVAPGTKVYLPSISIRVVDMAAYDQLIFALRRNGGVLIPFNAISGEQVAEDPNVPVDETLDAGRIELVAKSIAGTTEPGASPALNGVRVIARARGYLLSPRG